MQKVALLAALLVLLRCGVADTDAAPCAQGALGIDVGVMQRDGAVITDVLPQSPADVAGIRRGDVLLSVGGEDVRYACQVTSMVLNRDCSPVKVVVRRDGAKIEKTITPVEQASLYQNACDAGDALACYRVAWLAGDLANVKVLERACDRGVGNACTNLAYLHVTGTGVPKNEIRALDFYTRGCSYGDAHGCYNVGLNHDNGRGTTVSHSRAATAYEQACAAGVARACTNVGWLYERGLGVMKDPARTAELYRRGCEGSPCEGSNLRGCVNLGNVYRDGTGVEKDPARAAEIYREACGRKVDEDEEPTRLRACVLLGAFEIDGLGVKQDVASGLARSNEGCARGDALGCFNVAIHHANREDFPRAAEFYQKSCDANDAEACFELALLYDEAKGVPFDPTRSDTLLRRACTLGHSPACRR